MLGAGDSGVNTTYGIPTPPGLHSPVRGAHKGLEYCNTGQAPLWARGAEDAGNTEGTRPKLRIAF